MDSKIKTLSVLRVLILPALSQTGYAYSFRFHNIEATSFMGSIPPCDIRSVFFETLLSGIKNHIFTL